MSKISSSASKTSRPAKPAPKPAPKPAAKPQSESGRSSTSANSGSGSSKPTESARDNDNASTSNATRKPSESSSRGTEESRRTEEAREGREVERNNGVDEGSTTGNEDAVKDPETEDSFEGSQELQDELNGDDELREELKGLKDALSALFDNLNDEDEEEEVQAAESMGGCCGRKSNEASDSEGGERDWNSVLAAGVAAVRANDLLGGAGNNQPGVTPMAGPQGQGPAAAQGGVPLQGVRGSGNANQNSGPQSGNMGQPGAPAGQNRPAGQNVDPRQKLSSDYSKAQSAGAQLKPELEAEVRSLLGLPPLEGAQDGFPGMNPLTANPAAVLGQNMFGNPAVQGTMGNQFPLASGF